MTYNGFNIELLREILAEENDIDDNKYEDSDNNKCTLYQMVRREPDWSASRIRVCEKLEADREGLLTDIDTKNGIIQLHQTIEAKLKAEIAELKAFIVELCESEFVSLTPAQEHTYQDIITGE